MHILRTCILWTGTLLSLLVRFPTTSQAQNQPYIFQHLNREDGLASSIVLSIMQDRNGFMWFGTNNGLQRYDGRQFINYRYHPQDTNSLASDLVEALLQDSTGDIWIASSRRVTRFSLAERQFVRFPILSATTNGGLPRRWNLQECRGKIVLQSATQKDAYAYEPKHGAFVSLPPDQWRKMGCQDASAKLSLPPSHESYAYLQDQQGNHWAASEQLWMQRMGTKTPELIPQRNDFRNGFVYNQIYCIAQNREGTIWLGTDKGIYYFNPERQPFFFVEAPTKIDGKTTEPAVVTGFLETSIGEIWVSSLNKGLRVYDPHFRLLRSYAHASPGKSLQVWCAVEDALHRVWAGTKNGFLLISNNAVKPVTPPTLAGQTIVKAMLAKDGTIWWGTHTGLLVQHNPQTNQFRSINLAAQIGNQPLGRIQRLLMGKDGSLWVATSQAGVWHVNATTGQVMAQYSTTTRPQGLLSNEVGELIEYNDSTVTISTSLGLHFLDTKRRKITAFTTADGLPANAILNVVKASDTALFFTTQFSLGRWNPRTKTVTEYGIRDGILHESYAFNTGYQLRDGRILLGTLEGFYSFHPTRLAASQPLPNVTLTGFRIFDQPIALDAKALKEDGLHLAYNQNFFTIEFASLSYYDQDKITYEYQLEGVDPTWRSSGHNRFASYTNLDGGSYQFNVRARRDDGATTPYITTLHLSISHPFWKTGWFLTSLLLLLVGGIYGFYQLRINRLLALQHIRSRIARDLHDDMGSTLSTINIFSDLASQQVLANPTLARGYLQKISRYSHQMMEAIDDIVWSINPHNDSLQNLVSRMREVATELLEAKNIPFSIQADTTLNDVRLSLESRYDCFMIFKEALNNIAKHANCQQVWITLSVASNQLRVDITDDGQGIDPQIASSGNGLLNMQKRAQNNRGTLEVKSVPEKGTTVLLTFPLPKTTLFSFRV